MSVYCQLWTDFKHYSDVYIVNFEQVNAGGEGGGLVFAYYKPYRYEMYETSEKRATQKMKTKRRKLPYRKW